MKIRELLGATALVGVMVAVPTSAFAQATKSSGTPATKDEKEKGDEEESTNVTVTGSRIARPNDTSIVPITTVDATQLSLTARVSVGDVLNDLPQLNSTFSQANSTRFLGTGGLNLLDLRGLGTVRTLVLVNGRRHVGADILNNAVSPDINTFPVDLIEGVDIITGGNSAIYGSDALAGVVNFRLRDKFDGLQVRGQGAISERGDAGSYTASILAGKNFASGRGNIAVNLEYSRQNSFLASQRDYLSQTDGFVTVDQDAGGIAPGFTTPNTDGNPDAVFFRDIRVGTFSQRGLVAINGGPNATCGRDSVGRAFTCNYLFQPDGTVVLQNGGRVGLAAGTATAPSSTPAGSFIGGNGDTRRDGALLQLLPQLDRYAANLVGHFDFSELFTTFIEAKYVRTSSFSQGGSGPAFFTGSTIDAVYERPRLDNPFLSAQARQTLTTQLLSVVNAGINPNTSALLSATARTTLTNQINDGSFRFILRKNLTDLGTRSEQATRETWRIVGGARGTFNDDWKYELSVNYGQFDEATRVQGNIDVQRLALALDAVRNPAGQIVCGSQIDASRANASFGGDLNGNAANLATDIANCQPLNPFGERSISDAARNYVLRDTISRGRITQLDVLGFVTGDSSQLFSLPGGPVGFSLGAEYRRETARFRADPFVEQGYTFYNALAPFNPRAFEVIEGFGELRAPIVKDVFLLKELTLVGAGRVSGYRGSAGIVYTYNGGVDYSPVTGVSFRAQYGRAVRAPNLSDLFSSQSQNFAPGFGDPCSAVNIANGTQFRQANCLSSGIPANYDFRYAQSLEILSGGNPNLNVETTDSYTYGAVFQPKFIRGLSFSVDYFNIRVKNVITAPSAQAIVNTCYDSPTTANQFCNLFQRVAAGQTGPNGEEQFRIIEGSLQQTLLNYAALQTRGIDANVDYARTFGDVRFSTRATYTHYFQNDSFTDPTQPGFANTTRGELGQPVDAFNWNIDLAWKDFAIHYQLRYLGEQSVGAIENRQAFQGRAAQNLDDFDIPFYPEVIYMNLRAEVNFANKSNFFIGVDNLTDRIPPLGATGIGGGSGIFDNVGRRVYAGITARF